MSDLYYGGGSSYSSYTGYPPSFDPNNPMGGGGYTQSSGSISPYYQEAYHYTDTKQYADSSYTSEYFKSHINETNPYQKYYDIICPRHSIEEDILNASGNIYYKLDDYTARVYNNAYTDFENKATSAQTEYYATQTAIQNANIYQGKADLIASYGNIKDSSIASKIQQLADLTAQYEKLAFEDSITDYLNRIPNSNNASERELLSQQINELGNQLFQELTDYWRQQENIRRTQREFFGGFGWDNLSWITDPYFGKGGGQLPSIRYSPIAPVQQSPRVFFSLVSSGDMGDWMAGGRMYDSPRAGNVLFNPIGNLNTTVFLGLENQNFSPSMVTTLANPEPFKKFGTMAGDNGFSVLNFGIKI